MLTDRILVASLCAMQNVEERNELTELDNVLQLRNGQLPALGLTAMACLTILADIVPRHVSPLTTSHIPSLSHLTGLILCAKILHADGKKVKWAVCWAFWGVVDSALPACQDITP